jgi:hypothetical protein
MIAARLLDVFGRQQIQSAIMQEISQLCGIEPRAGGWGRNFEFRLPATTPGIARLQPRRTGREHELAQVRRAGIADLGLRILLIS